MTSRAQLDAEEILSVFESINVAHVRPGDVVIFRSPAPLNGDSRKHLVVVLEELFPDNESFILEGGQDIAVLRPEPAGMLRRWLGRLLRRNE